MDQVELVKRYLESDDADELRRMIASSKSTNAPGNFFTEDTIVNNETGDNLLHLAVRHFAENCVALLVSPEFSWNPVKTNQNNETPWTLARQTNYLPIIYPLTRLMIDIPQGHRLQTRRSVTEFFLFPEQFTEGSLLTSEVLGFADIGFVPGYSIELFHRGFHADQNLCIQNYLLLFELLLANPEVNPQPKYPKLPVFNFAGITVPIYSQNEPHDPNCEIYPTCLLNVMADQPESDCDSLQPWSQMLCVWATHRLGFNQGNVVNNSKNTNLMRLSDWCRVCLRRVASRKSMCYSGFLAQLNLPSGLQDFCSYKDFWPTVKTNLILTDSLKRPIQPYDRYETMYERCPSPDLDESNDLERFFWSSFDVQ